VKRITERMWFGGLAAAGVVVSHSLSYLFVAPDPHARLLLLQRTGHRYFTWIAALAVGALVAGLAGGTLQRLRTGRTETWSRPSVFVAAAATLAVLQIVGFIVLEGTERAVVGAGLTPVFAEPAVAIGIVMQVVVAVVGALLLVALADGVDRISDRLFGMGPSGRATRTVTWWATSVLPPTLRVAASGRTLRGPPVALS
jgi:hypothetical protein